MRCGLRAPSTAGQTPARLPRLAPGRPGPVAHGLQAHDINLTPSSTKAALGKIPFSFLRPTGLSCLSSHFPLEEASPRPSMSGGVLLKLLKNLEERSGKEDARGGPGPTESVCRRNNPPEEEEADRCCPRLRERGPDTSSALTL